MRGRKLRGTLALWGLLAVLGGGVVFAQAEQARITGVVQDETGQPMAGVEIILTPEKEGEGAEVKTRSNKKGRFAFPRVFAGTYKPAVKGENLALKSVEFVARSSGGVKLAEFKEEDVLRNGVPVIRVRPMMRGQLSLVVTTGEQAKEMLQLETARDTSAELQELNALFEQGKWQELLEAADKMLADYPDLAGALYLRAAALWRLERMEEAVAGFRAAAEKDPEQPGVWGALGTVLLEWGDQLAAEGKADDAQAIYGEALEALRKELERNPHAENFRANYVVVLQRLGRPEDEVAALRELLEQNPGNAAARLRLAELLTDLNRPEEAIAVLEQAPNSDQEVAIRIYNAAVVLWNAGKLEETIAAMDKAIAIAPDLAYLYQLKGRALIAQGKIREGIENLKIFVEREPDDPSAETDRQLIERLQEQLAEPQ